MPQGDWLVGGDRHAVGAERIYEAAAELISRDGLDAFDMDALAARLHCSRATIYRHAGGKAVIRDVIIAGAAHRIVDTVREVVDGLTGPDRVLTAISTALAQIRSDPLSRLVIATGHVASATTQLTDSPVLASLARDLAGLTDEEHTAAEWIVRVVLSLLFWPGNDAQAEQQMLQEFVAPAFTPPARPPLH